MTIGQEYRLYAGFKEVVNGKEKNFLGLPANSSIELTLPMVFWNAGTIQVVGDTADVRAVSSCPSSRVETHSGGRSFITRRVPRKPSCSAPLTGTGATGNRE